MGDTITFLKYGCETSYTETHVRIRVAPGGGTPLHFHTTYNEIFAPIKGILGIHLDGKELDVRVGEEATVEKGLVHCFRNRNAPIASSSGDDSKATTSALDSTYAPSPSLAEENKSSEDDPNTPYPNNDIEFHGYLRPSHPGFERSLYILYGLAQDGLVCEGPDDRGVPKSFVTTCMVMAMSDMALPGLGWKVFDPVIKGVAAWGRWMGWERELVERYCS